MKDLAYYTDYGTRPRSNDFKKFYVYSKGTVIATGVMNPTDAQLIEWRDKGFKIETEVDDVAYRAASMAHATNRNRLAAEFKADLFADYGVSGDKAEKAFKIAYDERHSAGYQEVIDLFSDLVELIK